MKKWNKLFSMFEVGLAIVCVITGDHEMAQLALLMAIVFAIWSLDEK